MTRYKKYLNSESIKPPKNLLKFFNICFLTMTILVLVACEEEADYPSIDKPSVFSFKIIDPVDGLKVEKVSRVDVHGTCDSSAYTDDIFIYPLVKSPDGFFYPYYKFSINLDHTWNTSLWLGDDSDPSGSIFYIYFCAVYKNDTTLFENAHVPDGSSIKDIGPDIPDYCTLLGKLTLVLK